MRRIPWFVSGPAVLALTGGAALLANVFLSDYFIRTFVNEADPFVATATAPAPDSTALATGTTSPAASGTATAARTQQASATPGGPAVVSQGTFRNGEPGHFGRGSARLGRAATGELVLRLEDFAVTGGPDLYVYLTADPAGEGIAGGLSLGRLKGTDGFQNYVLPDDADPAAYRAVVIWCRSFDVTFAIATLEAA